MVFICKPESINHCATIDRTVHCSLFNSACIAVTRSSPVSIQTQSLAFELKPGVTAQLCIARSTSDSFITAQRLQLTNRGGMTIQTSIGKHSYVTFTPGYMSSGYKLYSLVSTCRRQHVSCIGDKIVASLSPVCCWIQRDTSQP